MKRNAFVKQGAFSATSPSTYTPMRKFISCVAMSMSELGLVLINASLYVPWDGGQKCIQPSWQLPGKMFIETSFTSDVALLYV